MLFEASSHKVNGKLFHAPDYYIARIQANPTIHKYLTPCNYGLIHGDLHLGNVLLQNDKKLFLVDPNGAPYMPLEYDIGKILQSLHGGYGEIMRENYLLKYDQDGILLNVKKRSIYGLPFESLVKTLSDQQYARSLYTEAMHFISILPHHASDQNETTALFVRGLELFNELFYNLNIN
jgi:5-methylthioribose kinase